MCGLLLDMSPFLCVHSTALPHINSGCSINVIDPYTVAYPSYNKNSLEPSNMVTCDKTQWTQH